MPVFTQDASDYDVSWSSPTRATCSASTCRTAPGIPRPVVGTVGLVPAAWSRVHEQWGGTQLQRRFEKFAGRWMTERDYDAWVAMRSFGEAVTRAQTPDPRSCATTC